MTGFLVNLLLLVSSPWQLFTKLKTISLKQTMTLLFIETIAPALLLYIYYEHVNFPWLQGQLVAAMTPDQQAGALKLLSREFLMVSGIVGLVVTVPLFTAIFAVYFYLIGKIRGMSEGFRNWFAMVTWASAPAILALPIGLVTILLSDDGRFRPEETNPLTLNQLFVHAPPESAWRSLLESANVLVILAALLMGLGYSNWARVSLAKGLATGVVPYAVIYVTWTAVILATLAA